MSEAAIYIKTENIILFPIHKYSPSSPTHNTHTSSSRNILCVWISPDCIPYQTHVLIHIHLKVFTIHKTLRWTPGSLMLLFFVVVDHFYIALFSALEQTHCAHVLFYTSDLLFIARFWISTEVVYLQHWHCWCHMKLLPSWRVLCTPYYHAPCHFIKSHTHKMHACLAATCHLHFWQNDQDLLRATAVTQGVKQLQIMREYDVLACVYTWGLQSTASLEGLL